MIVSELLTKLGFVADTSALESFLGKMANAKVQIFAIATAIEEVGRRTVAFFSRSLEGIDQEGHFAQQVGLTVQQLQQLQYAAKLSGSSVEDFDQSFKNLNKTISQSAEGIGGGVEIFGRLGISTVQNGHIRSTLDILKEFSDKIKNLPVGRQEDFASRIGISNSTLLLLQKGSTEINKLSEEALRLGVYTQQDAEKSEQYVESIRRISQVFDVLRNQIAINLAPMLTKLVDIFTQFVTENKGFLNQGITAFVKSLVVVFTLLTTIIVAALNVLGFLYSVLAKIGNIVLSVVNFFGGFKNLIEILVFASLPVLALRIGSLVTKFLEFGAVIQKVIVFFTELNVLAKAELLISLFLQRLAVGIRAVTFALTGLELSLGVITASVVALIALGLVAQDLWVWAKGGHSFFKDLFSEIDFKKKTKEAIDFTNSVQRIFSAEGFIRAIIKNSPVIESIFKKVAQSLRDSFYSVFDGIKQAYDNLINFFETRIKNIENFFTGLGDRFKNTFSLNMSSPIMNALPNSVKNIVTNNTTHAPNTTQHTTFNVTVHGGGDKNSIVQAVKKGIYDASRQANRNNTSPAVL